MGLAKLDKQMWKTLLAATDTFLFDCDGVLWHGNQIIPGSDTILSMLKDLGKRVVLVTNNSTKSREQYVSKCEKLKLPIDSIDHIVTTSCVCSNYLKSLKFSGKVYVVGSGGIGHELDMVGIPHLGIGADVYSDYTDADMLYDVPLDDKVNCVVVGFDGHFSYVKMLKAATYLRCPDHLFVATNDDATIPSSNGNCVVAGTGAIVSAIITASGRNPVVLGKPNRPMWDYLNTKFHLDPKRTVMIGDRCNTDIKFGNDNGLTTLVVLTGDSSLDQMEKFKLEGQTDLVPHFYTDSMGSLVEIS